MPALPIGAILAWKGAIIDIPDGYLLCDGNNGTPDLRDRMIIGAGDTYAPDDTGGAVNHNHTFTGDGHTHDWPAGVHVAGPGLWDKTSLIAFAAGTTDNANGLPPYYALAWIMKT